MAETGHARNVEHFQQMISFCTGYGTDYDATNAMIEFAALNAALTDAKTALDNVQSNVAP
jgi:ribonuclease HI